MTGLIGYLHAYWTGLASFRTALVALLGIGILAGIGISRYGDNWPLVSAAALFGFVAFLLVGAVRTSDRLINEGYRQQAVWTIYCSTIILLVASGISAASLFLPLPVDAVVEVAQDPKVVIENEHIAIRGSIDFQTLNELRAVFGRDKHPKVVLLESTGGLVFAGRTVGLLIEKAGLDTVVEADCFSACTLVFAGGRSRTLGAGGRLGFHGYQFERNAQVQLVDVAKVESRDRDYLQRRGFSAEFLNRVYLVDPDDIWIPTRAELAAAGVTTGP